MDAAAVRATERLLRESEVRDFDQFASDAPVVHPNAVKRTCSFKCGLEGTDAASRSDAVCAALASTIDISARVGDNESRHASLNIADAGRTASLNAQYRRAGQRSAARAEKCAHDWLVDGGRTPKDVAARNQAEASSCCGREFGVQVVWYHRVTRVASWTRGCTVVVQCMRLDLRQDAPQQAGDW